MSLHLLNKLCSLFLLYSCWKTEHSESIMKTRNKKSKVDMSHTPLPLPPKQWDYLHTHPTFDFPTKATRHPFTAKLRNEVFNAHCHSAPLAVHHSTSFLVYYDKQVIQTHVDKDCQQKANVSHRAEAPITVLLKFQVWTTTALLETPQSPRQSVTPFPFVHTSPILQGFTEPMCSDHWDANFNTAKKLSIGTAGSALTAVRQQRIISWHCFFSFWKLILGLWTIMLLRINCCDLKFSHEETTRGNIKALILRTWIRELFNSSQWRGNIVLLIYSLKIMICIST